MKFSRISIVGSLLALGSAQLDTETTPVVSSDVSPSVVIEKITGTEGGSTGYQTDSIYPTTTGGESSGYQIDSIYPITTGGGSSGYQADSIYSTTTEGGSSGYQIDSIYPTTTGGSSGYQTDSIYPTNTAGYTMSSDYVTTAQGTVTSVKYDGENKSTVWVYPTGTGNKKYCTVATYEDNVVIDVNIVDITIIIIDGFLFSETVTLAESATYTPTPPPKQSTTTAPYSAGTGTNKPNAKIHNVIVGDKGLNIYSPNQINAKIGDTIHFQFLAKNHTVTQSNFNTPCVPNHGFDTGFNQFNPNNLTNITRDFIVNTDKPIWFFCAQTVPISHCQDGMVLGVNPAGKFDDFLEKAKGSNGTSEDSTGGDSTTASVSAEMGAGTGYVGGGAAETGSVDSSSRYYSVRGRAFRA